MVLLLCADGGLAASTKIDGYEVTRTERERRNNYKAEKAAEADNGFCCFFVCEKCGAVYWRISRPSGEIVWRCSNKVKHGGNLKDSQYKNYGVTTVVVISTSLYSDKTATA